MEPATEQLAALMAKTGASSFAQALLTVAGDDMLLLDASGRIVFCGTHISAMLKYQESALLGHQIDEFVPMHLPLPNNELPAGQQIEATNQLVTKDGEFISVSCLQTPLYDGDNHCCGAVLLVRKPDSNEKASVSQLRDDHIRILEESNHRVRNNLAMICALLDMEIMQAPENERHRLRVTLARTRSLSLIHNLVQHTNPGFVEVGILTRAVIDSVRSLYPQTEGTIAITCPTLIHLSVKRATYLGLTLTELAVFLTDCAIAHERASSPSITVASESDGQFSISIEGTTCSHYPECCKLPQLSKDIITGLVERSLGGHIAMKPDGPFHVTITCPITVATT
ncbi:MAG TPA: histidine kinase dimerization/phosphoacceptor domain -containing protein [Armatimonadota bacterium]|nr:histidine kinase dimerization/phosphoacceptor domain -containing protein [Armatimonadota bacterium]